jgi:hypothetical protein
MRQNCSHVCRKLTGVWSWSCQAPPGDPHSLPRALAQTTEAESAEIIAAGLDLAEAAAGDLQDARFNLRLHLYKP